MKYLWFLLADLPLSLLRVVVALMGPLMVTLALPFAKDNHLPKLFSWWDNPTYGVKGNEAYLTNKAYNPLLKYAGKFPSNWYWLAIRNPANGLVESPVFSVVQADCEYVRYKGTERVDNGLPGWQFIYAKKGWRLYTGFYHYIGKGEYRLGFKLLPHEPQRKRRVGMTFIVNPFKNWDK